MMGPDEPPPGQERGDKPNSRKQITLRLMNATSGRSVMDSLRAFFRSIATTRLKGNAASLRALSILAIILAGIAAFFRPMDSPWNNAGRLDAVELAVKRLETRLASSGLGRTTVANPTTLLVAIQFVTAAAERSTPFDTALAVAISMTGQHPKIGPLLDQLLAEATTGVPSLEDLRRDFLAKLAELEKDGLFTDIGAEPGISSFRLSRFLGLAEAEISPEHRATLQSVAADVANQNLGEAVQRVAKLDGRVREGLEDWRGKAERRVAIDIVLAELRRAAFLDLIDEAS